jgi:DNA recombination protein RmuC
MPANFYSLLALAFGAGLVLGLLLMWLIARAGKGRLQAGVQRLPQLEEELKALQGEKVQLHEEIATLKASREADAEKLTWLDKAQESMREAFQALASQTLRSNSEEFLKTHREQLQNLVQPLDKALQDMRQNVRELEGKREGAYGELKENLGQLFQLSRNLQTETSKLSHALKAGVKQRGQWAEFQLQRLAEMAGMKEHVDFDQQFTVGDSRLDMVVWLPRGGCIVVDAKAPMSHYLEAIEQPTEESRQKKLEEHARRVRLHIDSLSSKEYWRKLPEGSEFVVMYLPSDACLIAALDADHNLLEHAFKCRITLTTPTTIFAMLKTVATAWQQYQIAENAQRIFEQGHKLSHRLQIFFEHLDGVGRGLETALRRYNDAAGSYERMLQPAIRDFRKLGVDTDEPPEVKAVDTQPRQLQPPGTPEEPASD